MQQDTAAELAYLRAQLDEARFVHEWQEVRYHETTQQVLALLGQRQALLTRAEAAESMLGEAVRSARYTDRLLAVAPTPATQLAAVYELGALMLVKLIHAPPPPHPRLLLDKVLEFQPERTADGARPQSCVHDEDPTISAIAAAVSERLAAVSSHQGNEGDAHARARYHQGKWAGVATGGAGATAALHSTT